MIRHRLTDEQWGRIAHLIPGKPGDPGRTGDDNRLFVDAIVWMARTERHGAISHRSSANGTACGSASGDGPRRECGSTLWRLWQRIPILNQSSSMERLSGRNNMRPEEKGDPTTAIGRSRGGLSTKIHIAVDALGNVLRLLYTAGRCTTRPRLKT